jgi:hypothetical protein
MAFDAATRALWCAFSSFMMLTSVLMASAVCSRAMSLTSATIFGLPLGLPDCPAFQLPPDFAMSDTPCFQRSPIR